jgi:cobalt/nickel transport system permease protein
MSDRPPTPDWLTRPELGLCPCGCIGRRSKGNYVTKTLAGTAGVLQQAVFADDLAGTPGALQRVDPRVKLIGLLAMLVTVSLIHSIGILVVLYVLTLGLAAWSSIRIGFFVKRVWLFIPIFTGVIALPATLNLITPGHVVVPLGTWSGHPVGVTSQGLWSAGLLVARVAVSVSLIVLVTLTTGWTRLLGAMRALYVPRLFVAVFALAYRYLFTLLDSVTDMFLARRARTVRPEDHRGGRRFVVAAAGATFGKAHQLSGEVHEAMIARGYVGDVRTLAPAALTAVDAVAIAAIATTIALTLLTHHALG